MATDPKSLLAQANCYACFGANPYSLTLIKLSLLQQLVAASNPSAATDAPTLLKQANCFQCFGPNEYALDQMKIGLMVQLAAGVATDPKTLLGQALCDECFGANKNGLILMELALLAQQVSGATDAPTLLSNAKCYECFTANWYMEKLIELVMWKQIILGEIATPVTDPNALLGLAKCNQCFTPNDYSAELLEIALLAGGGIMFAANLVPAGSIYALGGNCPAEFDLTVLTNTTYIVTWGSNDVTLKLGTQTFTSCGVNCQTIVYTGANTQMVFCGNSAGTTVTVRVQRAPAAVAPPTGFTWTLDGTGANVMGAWNAPVGVAITGTEVWTSTDGVNYTLATTVAAPGNTYTTPISPGQTIYGEIRFVASVNPNRSAFTGPLNVTAPTLLNGLLSYWNLNDAGSTNKADTLNVNNLSDANNNSGAVAALIGNGVNVVSGAPTYLKAASSNSLKIVTGSSKSFSFWYNPLNPAANEGILAKWGATGDYLCWISAGSQFLWQLRDGGGTVRSIIIFNGIPANGWHHIVVGYDDANSQIFAYLDNGARINGACVGATASADDFTLGTYFSSAFNAVGKYDEAGMWGRVLNASEVNTLFNGGAGKTYPFT